MAEDEELCSCEYASLGDLGSVSDEEYVARVVLHPVHILKKDGTVKPGVFPPKHIRESGLSLMRTDKMDEDELTKQAEAVLAGSQKGKHVQGVLLCQVSRLRTIYTEGRRSICVTDDPVKDHKVLPDNPAHAVSIQSHILDESEIERIRSELMDIFDGPTPIAEVYGC